MYVGFTLEYNDNRYLDFYDEVNTEEQVRKHYPNLTNLDWDNICLVGNLSLEFVLEFEQHINWRALSRNINLNKRIISVYKSTRLDWDEIWRFHTLSVDFINEYIHYMKAIPFLENEDTTYELIHQFAPYLNWYEISNDQYVCTDEFVREFADYIVWNNALSNGRVYEESILREYLPKMDLYLLVSEQLAWQGKENLLRELKDKIKWDDYLNSGYAVFDGHKEVYDYWWGKKKAVRERFRD